MACRIKPTRVSLLRPFAFERGPYTRLKCVAKCDCQNRIRPNGTLASKVLHVAKQHAHTHTRSIYGPSAFRITSIGKAHPPCRDPIVNPTITPGIYNALRTVSYYTKSYVRKASMPVSSSVLQFIRLLAFHSLDLESAHWSVYRRSSRGIRHDGNSDSFFPVQACRARPPATKHHSNCQANTSLFIPGPLPAETRPRIAGQSCVRACMRTRARHRYIETVQQRPLHPPRVPHNAGL
jgi:hypothetical protein